MSHEHAQVVVYRSKLLVPQKCVCLERKREEQEVRKDERKVQQETLQAQNERLRNQLPAASVLLELIRDKDMTELLDKETKQKLPASQLMPIFEEKPFLMRRLVESLIAARSAGPHQWQKMVAKCRATPHTRKHLTFSQTTTMIFATDSYIQSYMGAVVPLTTFQIQYDVDSGRDVARALDVQVPLYSNGGDIFYDMDVFLPLSGDTLAATRALEAQDCDGDVKERYGFVTITIAGSLFEKQPLVCGDNGLHCRLLTLGLPSHALMYVSVLLTCYVPISPALDAPLSLPTQMRYRCSTTTFRDRKERDVMMEMPISVMSCDGDQSPWLIKNGMIAKVFTDKDGKACLPLKCLPKNIAQTIALAQHSGGGGGQDDDEE